ncbi:DUF6167 family protein [Nocardioides acrostichi]|uniref:Secreted protein n=1 Tax=Nocardioides acrostichi TaxID=2784339 RepID=A0A930Y6B8_9ACTN|nr:DUF6167 family protein [Nocardioides acrostichi]MBF4162185.1 hypothetical protein [Nocardioides acrostichi]
MRRGLWFAAGAGAGVWAAARARRAAEALTVDGLRDRAGAAALGLRMLRDEVAQGRADAETGVRQRLGVPSPGDSPRQLQTPAHHRLAARSTTTDTNEEGTD